LISASLYITACTTKNRVVARLRRLREPRYLIGAVVGIAYFYFSIFMPRRARARRVGGDGRGPFDAAAAWQTIGTPLAGLLVFVLALCAWFLPVRAGLLEFSRAETAFLFPAPVSRRELLIHRLVRSQVSSLVTAIVMAIILPSAGFGRLRVGLSMWVLFVTIRVYFAAVGLTRAQLGSRDPRSRLTAWTPIAFFAVVSLVVASAIARQMTLQPVAGPSDFFVRLAGAVGSGLPRLVLWPFTASLLPQFATSVGSFIAAFAASLTVLALVMVWMLVNDGAFEAVAGEAAEQRAAETSIRRPTVRVRQLGPPLALTGRLDRAILWKNAMQTFRAVNLPLRRIIGPAIGLLFGLTGAAVGMAAGQNRGPAGFIAALGFAVTGLSVFLGPLIMRLDLRSDFEHLEVIKTWPVRPAELIRGEMAWPAAFVTAFAWAGILAAALFGGTAMPSVSFMDRWSYAAAAFLAAPAVVAAQYTVQNALAVFFPAWVSLGNQRTRGIDAMGQRLIMLAAILLALLLFAGPGAIAAAVVWFVLRGVMNAAVFVPVAVAFAGVVLVEVLMATELLGPAYERLDLTSVERVE
jgi:hypothetical protein